MLIVPEDPSNVSEYRLAQLEKTVDRLEQVIESMAEKFNKFYEQALRERSEALEAALAESRQNQHTNRWQVVTLVVLGGTSLLATITSLASHFVR